MTPPTPDQVHDVATLEAYVQHVLCVKENLVPEQFRMTVRGLVKSGRDCGLQFTLQGPRGVRLEAIWAADQNLVYFYNAVGERFQKVQLPRRFSSRAA